MKLVMSGIDFKSTPLELRSRAGFGAEEAARTIREVCGGGAVSGCAILSTCVRTEIYMSFEDGGRAVYPDPAALLLERCAGLEGRITTMYGEDAARHLSEVACGLHSAVLCEEQIVTQVNEAAALSRAAGGMDAALNTLFRCAVSAGKKALTNYRISAVPPSAASRAADMAEELFGSLRGKRALVIGSGKMGYRAAEELMKRGCDVKITVRSYRTGQSLVPRGAVPVEYAARMAYIAESDLLISATRSPHFTVTLEAFRELPSVPGCIFDLAVPRDIQPEIGGISRCFDIDDIYTDGGCIVPDLSGVYSIADGAAREFERWARFKSMLTAADGQKGRV